jgi:hypothetical protein
LAEYASTAPNPTTGEGVTAAPEQPKLPDAGAIKRLWDEGVQRRRTVDNEAKTNIAFIAGDHYAVFDPVSQKFIKPVPDGRVRLKVNHIQPLWRGEVATLTESKPQSEVLPATAEDGDEAVALVANQILDYELSRLEFDQVRLEAVMWLCAAGYSFFHPCWDPDTNEVTLEALPHFEVVVDPAARYSTREARWVLHGRTMTPEEAFDRFGQEFKPDTTVPNWSTNLLQSGQSTTDTKPQEGVLVLRLWYRPCRKYPQGFVRTVVGGKVLEDIPFPYEHKELPFIDIHHVRIPGRYAGQAMVTQLIPLQKDYNQNRSRMAEIRGLLSAPKWIAAEGQMDVERLTSKPGEIVTFRPMGPYRPEPMQVPQAPAFLFQDAQQAYNEMQDIAGQHEVSRGQTPGSGIPAAGIVALQEKDSRKLATTISSLENAVSRVGKQVLELVKQYWEIPKMVRVWSDETGVQSVKLFANTDIKGQFDVRVVPGSALPKSKTQERQDLLSLWDRRVISDPRLLLRLIELPSLNTALEVFDKDERQALREHDHILRGDPEVAAELWHNHGVHIAEHNDFRKTELFEAWEPEQKAMLADHVQQHEDLQQQVAQEEMQKQLALQPPMPGAPAAGAGPVPPSGPTDIGGAIPGVNAPMEQNPLLERQALTNAATRAARA